MKSSPVYIKFTVVYAQKDIEHDAWLVKAEGKMGARISWFQMDEPEYKPGDEFGIAFMVAKRSR